MKASISSSLQVFNLKEETIELQKINNRRFMFHPSGILILGDENMVNSKNLLYSHAEEFGEAGEYYKGKLPPFDDFVRGWIGVGGDYPEGIIHFAPHIPSDSISCFNAAFDFIVATLQNGFSHKSMLRGFCEPWEQPVSNIIAPAEATKPSLDKRINKVKTVAPAKAPFEAPKPQR